ncbi:gastrin/cholecystokinin type B receptor-like [Asterias rubens]|uniref:gastrin/cholecystokinin type B receptor-like n=1 Tax=Asterias rubens TaxID=7604 RepID=UPI001455CBAF|nr:gastrin/cholecystokinin type B receptor-like [Asterias rubens]
MLLGLFGNSLILGVYWPKPNKTSTNILIMGLAGMDLTVCMMRVHNLAVFISFLANKETPFAFQYIRLVSMVSLFASAVLTGFIAVDRYDCVCRPYNRWLNRFGAKLLVLGSYGLAIILLIPLVFSTLWMPDSNALRKAGLVCQLVLYIVVIVFICIFYGKVYITIRNHVKVNVLSRHLVENDRLTAVGPLGDSRSRNVSSIAGNVSSLMPSTKVKPLDKVQHKSMTKATQNTPSTSRKSESLRSESLTCSDTSMAPTDGKVNATAIGRPPVRGNPNQDRRSGTEMSLQRKTTRMLFITSIVFLLTWFPYWLYVAVLLAKLDGADISENVITILWYCTLTTYINNVVNPLIYGVANRRFRKDCQVVLRKMKI